MSSHLERAFEEHIEAHLLAHGWARGNPTTYDRALGMDSGDLRTFLDATQHTTPGTPWSPGTAARTRRNTSSRAGWPTS